MGRMELDALQTENDATPCSVHEIVDHFLQARLVERLEGLLARRMGYGRRRLRAPAHGLGRRDLFSAVPGLGTGRLAARMSQLDRKRDIRMNADRRDHLSERGFIFV